MRRATALCSALVALALASCESQLGSVAAAGAAGMGGDRAIEAGGAGSPPAAAAGESTARAGGGASANTAGSSGSANSAGSEAAGSAGASDDSCGSTSIGELEVYLSSSNWDPLGYPPYAVDDCTLVYVAAGSDAGALHVRNLATGVDEVLETAQTKPRRPTVSGALIAWEADGANGSELHVRVDGNIETVSGAFVRAEETRATDDAVVFTAFLGPNPNDDSDVYLFDARTGELSAIATGPGQQRFADVSPTHVAFTDFSEDPRGYFDEMGSVSDVAIVERASGQRSNRSSPGKQAFPLLGDNGVFAYLEWAAIHPEPKLGQFWLKAGRLDRPVSEDYNVKTTGQVTTNPAYVRPSLRGLKLDFIDQGSEGLALYRTLLSAPDTLIASKIAGSTQLFGPVAGERFTLLANQRSAQSLALLAVPR